MADNDTTTRPAPIAICRSCGSEFHVIRTSVMRLAWGAKPEDGSQICTRCLRDNIMCRELTALCRRLDIAAFVLGVVYVQPKGIVHDGNEPGITYELDIRRLCSNASTVDGVLLEEAAGALRELMNREPMFGPQDEVEAAMSPEPPVKA